MGKVANERERVSETEGTRGVELCPPVKGALSALAVFANEILSLRPLHG